VGENSFSLPGGRVRENALKKTLSDWLDRRRRKKFPDTFQKGGMGGRKGFHLFREQKRGERHQIKKPDLPG